MSFFQCLIKTKEMFGVNILHQHFADTFSYINFLIKLIKNIIQTTLRFLLNKFDNVNQLYMGQEVDMWVGNKGSLVDLVGSCCAPTGKTDRRLKRREEDRKHRKRVGGRDNAWLNNSCWDYCLIKAVICMHSLMPPYRADQKALLCEAQ